MRRCALKCARGHMLFKGAAAGIFKGVESTGSPRRKAQDASGAAVRTSSSTRAREDANSAECKRCVHRHALLKGAACADYREKNLFK